MERRMSVSMTRFVYKIPITDEEIRYGKKCRTCGARGFHWKKDDDSQATAS
jgi:hypothetical protein